MMKTWYLLGALLWLTISCTYKNTKEQTQQFADQFTHDEFVLEGDYHWNFQLMGGEQHSTHTFFSDSITYTMKGKVYSTDYTMEKLSYDESLNKWIGQDESGIVYVLFFKDQTDSSLTIYKRKCSDNGLEEALHFDLPAPDATEDRGWNVYTKTIKDQEDILPFSGIFAHPSLPLLTLSDPQASYENRIFKKLSYHAGERRWVGQADSIYLQIFFEHLPSQDSIKLSIMQHTDLEKAYRTDYHTAHFVNYSVREN